MIFNKCERLEPLGKQLGLLFSYLLFTTILYFVLSLTGKLPLSWGYLHVMGISIFIVALGMLIRRFLE
jgi:hypothetical protein